VLLGQVMYLINLIQTGAESMLETGVGLLGDTEIQNTQMQNTGTHVISTKPLPSMRVKEKMKFTWLVVHLVVIPRLVADQVNMDTGDGQRTIRNAISQVTIVGCNILWVDFLQERQIEIKR
jgi:hypothetical protein